MNDKVVKYKVWVHIEGLGKMARRNSEGHHESGETLGASLIGQEALT